MAEEKVEAREIHTKEEGQRKANPRSVELWLRLS
jgi:hypothetical protein